MTRYCVVLLLAACDREEPLPDAAMPVLEQVALVPVAANRDVDVLFVLDDSPATLHMQTGLKEAFPAFIETLERLPGGMPNLHLGVVTSDLGATAADGSTGPSIGTGPGSCSGAGKDGRLQTNGSTLIDGPFISDLLNIAAGTRTTNYTGALVDAFAAIASVGSSGCGFEQPVQATKRALDNHPANAGFLRPTANLAIVMMADEDDCSLSTPTLLSSETAILGPLQSFRCTRFGIRCDEDINTVGDKTNCRSNEKSSYVMAIAPYADYLSGLKESENQVYVASITGPNTPVSVELRTPPGGGVAVPALAHACRFAIPNSGQVADPAVRITELAGLFARHTTTAYCAYELVEPMRRIARNIRSMVGDPCLTEDIAMPAECVVHDKRGTSATEIPQCTSDAPTTTCYQLVTDPACTTTQQLSIQIQRATSTTPDTWVEVRCRL